MVAIDVTVIDESSVEITFTYADEEGTAATPDTAFWTLTNSANIIQNSREDVEIVTPTTADSILLEGDDLDTANGLERIITIYGTYTSSTWGSGIKFKQQGNFTMPVFNEPIPSA